MLLRGIRKYRRAARIPLIIMVVMISVSLVGSYIIWQSPSVSNPVGGNQTSLPESLRNNIRLYQQALKTNPEDVNLLIALGNSQYDLGAYYFDIQDFEEGKSFFKAAVSSYQKALEKVPENINVRVDLATAAFYCQEYDLAEKHFKKALEQNPRFLNARLNYGIFLLNARNDREGAIQQWQAALETNPDEQTAAYLKSLIERVKEQGTSAK